MDEDRKARLTASFAGAHKRFLSINHPADYARLEKAGQLQAHLMNIGEEAAEHYLLLETQLRAKAEEIADLTEKQAYLNQIPQMAQELVIADIIDVKR